MKINFVLSGEGSSDLNLIDHIENLLIEEGFEEVSGKLFEPGKLPNRIGHAVIDKIRAIVRLHPSADLIIMHRDADNVGLPARRTEIVDAALEAGCQEKVVPLVPVTSLETWLLCDEQAIRSAAGNPRGRVPLNNLPRTCQLESVRDSKQLLEDVLVTASELQGAKLRELRKRFGRLRARLALELRVEGPVRQLRSYEAFRTELITKCSSTINSYTPR